MESSSSQGTDNNQPRRRRGRPAAKTVIVSVAKPPRPEPLSRTVDLLNAALRVWEAKHNPTPFRSVWQRSSQAS